MLRVISWCRLRSPCTISRQLVQRSTNLHVYEIWQRQAFHGISTVILPPLVFSGLVLVLWTWKCFMMVLFQNKIIYMPGLPPNARRETIADYSNRCGGIQWKQKDITADDGTRISLATASVDSSGPFDHIMKRVYILYFQGNTSSLPPRLPFLSPVLRLLQEGPHNVPLRYTIVCCSYRGYWTSKGRPTEKGISLDAIAALNWIKEEGAKQIGLTDGAGQIELVIWGQSIGAGVATNLAAKQVLFSGNVALRLLILETPFLSIRSMLETLYPQKWLPYRYLWPFLRNRLDSWEALGTITQESKRLNISPPKVLLLQAGKDELVPGSHGQILDRRCLDLGLDVNKRVIANAFHTEIMMRPEGRLAIADAIREASIQHLQTNLE